MLNESQKQKLDETRKMAQEELAQIDKEIASELTRVKEKLIELQQAKKAMKQIYDGACARMGVKSTVEVTHINLNDIVKSA